MMVGLVYEAGDDVSFGVVGGVGMGPVKKGINC